MVTMRDGVRIAVDIYKPKAQGRYPALLSMSPYGKERQRMPGGIFTFVEAGDIGYFVSKGYAYIIADSRGSSPSEGRWNLFDRKEQQDGFELVEWMARQSWCDSQVAMIGESYFGLIQYLVAATRPPSLKTIVPFDAMTDLYRDFCYHGGLFNLGFMPMWLSMVNDRCLPRLGDTVTDKHKLPQNVLLDIQRRPSDGPYYWQRSARTRFNRITIPVFHLACASQFIHCRGHLMAYNAIKSPKKLYIGAGSPWAFFHSKELSDQICLWLDYWLKGVRNGIMDEPEVTMYVPGADEWRYEREYPLARTQWTKFYLHSGEQGPANEPPYGLLSQVPPGDETPDNYPYPESQRAVEANLPVLGYSTPPLKKDMEVVGPASLVMYAASTAEDAAWMVKLDDVAPDGSFTVASKGWLKASHREVDEAKSAPGRPFHTHANPTPIEPGEVYRYEIEIWPVFRLFKAGHRLRLRIASSDSRTWDANSFHSQVELPMTNTVYHDKRYPSHLLLPLVPANSRKVDEKPTITYKPTPPLIGGRASWAAQRR